MFFPCFLLFIHESGNLESDPISPVRLLDFRIDVARALDNDKGLSLSPKAKAWFPLSPKNYDLETLLLEVFEFLGACPVVDFRLSFSFRKTQYREAGRKFTTGLDRFFWLAMIYLLMRKTITTLNKTSG